MSSRSLDDLDPRIRPLVFEFLARCVEAKVPILILNTLRTIEEQAENVKKGVSWTMHSKHLPQAPSNLSLAVDVAPISSFKQGFASVLNWNEKDPSWSIIGRLGESVGLQWGIKLNGKHVDLGHFQLNV